MTLNEFLKYVETGKPLKGDEIHQFMNEMSDEARRMTFELNGSYHDPEEIRELLSRLFNKPVFSCIPPVLYRFRKEYHGRQERFHQRLLSFSRSWRGDTG